MQVSQDEASALRERRNSISQLKEVNADFKGVHDCLVKILWWEARMEGNNIVANRPFPWLSPRWTFTQEEIEEVALRKFARYMHYELGRGLKDELNIRAYNAHKGNAMEDWLYAQVEIAKEISSHYGTPLEAVN